uniref:hypothetical protein n=1 Tax=Mesorhizobium sp. WSM4875 TaxID=3038539 RepID=UPI0024E1AE47|nr:hypothetical protein [Mesorhizobium sp. WSM4875]
MIGKTWLAALNARLLRWLKLVPALFSRDPLFRYATIAAVLALIFLAVSTLQDVGGHRGGPFTGPARETTPDNLQNRDPSLAEGSQLSQPPAPGSATPAPAAGSTSQPPDAEIPAVAPGRPLQGIQVAPTPRDSFGIVPEKGKSP